MGERPEEERQDGGQRVYLSASNHFMLGLKTFGYMLIGYLTVGLVIAVVLAVVWLVSR